MTEFSYRYNHPLHARILISFETQNRHIELPGILRALESNGMPCNDLTHNEVAKTHGRYLVGGGRSGGDENLLVSTDEWAIDWL